MESRPSFRRVESIPYFSHQTRDWDLGIPTKPEHALFWNVGTGKTRFELDSAALSYCQGIIDAVLVVAPNGVHRDTWVGQQIPQWLQVPYAADYYVPKSQASASRWRELNTLPERPGLVILTTYYDALQSNSGWEFARAFCERYKGRLRIVCDESHRIMSPGSLAATRMAKLRDLAVQRRIMTATPTGNGLENLYSQFRFLGRHILGVSTFAEYKGMFCVEEKIPGTDFKKISGYRNVKYLNKLLSPYVSVAPKPDNLPPRFWLDVHTSLSEEQSKAYRELKNDFQTQLRTGQWVEAELSIVRYRRLQQIVAGHLTIPNDTGLGVRDILELECPRIDDALDRVVGAKGKTIVWAEEQFEVERLGRELKKRGIGYACYYGGVKSGDARSAALVQFDEDPNCLALLANGQTGNAGLQLTGKVAPVGDTVFYSHTWSRIIRDQCEGRNHRPGAFAESVTYHDMIARGTVDVTIRRRVKNKQDVADLISDPQGFAAALDEDLDYQPGQQTLTFGAD